VSSEPVGRRSLAWYIREFVAVVDAHDRYAAARLRLAAGDRRARITLDDETVVVRFEAGGLVVSGDEPALAVDGEGRSDSWTVADILDGRIEATDALLTGRVEAIGDLDAVAAMLHIIDIVLDIAVRAPELQLLARELVASLGERQAGGVPNMAWYPHDVTDAELAVLGRLDLLPDEG
jgi:putative sterol carrier protein